MDNSIIFKPEAINNLPNGLTFEYTFAKQIICKNVGF